MRQVNTKIKYKKQSDVEKLAEEIFNDYDLDVPVEVVEISRKEGIDILDANFKDIEGDSYSGAIVKDGNSTNIYVNREDSTSRKRFTIAHELGHYFLGHLKEKGERVDLHRKTGYNTDMPEERLANQFAAALLMNSEIVKINYNILRTAGLADEYIVSKLADLFAVSKSAMRYRLKNLGIV